MADRVLRDHTQPCGDPLDEGGRYQYTDETWGCDAMGCPGGREVTIDYEAAGSMLAELRRVHVVMVDADHSARRIIGAALGEDDPSSVAALREV